ncbi:beta-ketoacyl-[acyl-carrier-protein] synthase family protein [Halioxenophilus sp. WMMB6]|uniref:beta-ketoacyl-[acyl-carrier-protein] synthase family protein n=1 Tax=Halioxenophilus sp. WMMB6 TaxID=3073815 RepID=UPI00295E5687|nr:beta-ketoacyl-[acyl-carrier-protein] synthase family protein [Halioxenophilus sp. WMMB6]
MSEATRYTLVDLGIINALGSGKESVLANFLAGHAPGMAPAADWLPNRELVCGQVLAELPALPAELAQFGCRNNRLLLAALEQIAGPVAEAISRFGRQRVGAVIGSSTSGILEGERALAAQAATGAVPAGYHYRQQEIGTSAVFVGHYLGLQGPCYTVSTACSSSAKAFASARNLLELNLCDAVIVGGSDSLCKLTINGFSALESVSPTLCNPFSRNRQGITIGEAAALFLMMRGDGPVALLGVGEASDAHHISAPHPEGVGAASAMRGALNDAGLAPEAIDYLNLHGTATPQNDAMESLAVAEVLGLQVPCSSTKPLTGHTLGAAGATEVGLCWLLASQAQGEALLPAQLWDGEPDPALPTIALSTGVRRPSPPRYLMSNSFAFGGSNCSVIIGRE